MIIARLCDVGCLENILPVVKKLMESGLDVGVYLDVCSIAKEKISEENFSFVDSIPCKSLVLSCLPLGEGFQQLKRNRNRVLLLQENPNLSDPRIRHWNDCNVLAVCSLVKQSFLDFKFFVTGLPVIDNAAQKISTLSRIDVCKKIDLDQFRPVVFLALPGVTNEVMRVLDLIEDCYETLPGTLMARTHPKLFYNDPVGFKLVRDRINSLSVYDLDYMNQNLTAHESIVLTSIKGSHFVGTHETSLNWQFVSGRGDGSLHVIPPNGSSSVNWIKTVPIVSSCYGRPFDGYFTEHNMNKSLMTSGSVKRIVEVVESFL